MDKEKVIKTFIRNFVLKGRRERAELELTTAQRRHDFADRLNHSWWKLIDMNKLKNLPNVEDDFEYVKRELSIKDDELCYVVSNYDDIDDKVMKFVNAFEASYARGFGTLIISLSADRLYLETEEIGNRFRFTGRLG